MTLAAADWKDPPAVYLMSKSYHFAHATPDQADALVATDYKCPPIVNADWRVRMITPLECARLQGFPDWWTDGVDGSDSAKYKMYGNAIAVPCAYDVLRRIAENDH